ncbi:catalase/peroxidase HPI [Chytriomyces cf. hyalinus JEL632]|nr:catalase/peroxidase HPI [Chytriomyces cf. hyalinus JEL632]
MSVQLLDKTSLGDNRYKGDRELDNPLAAVQMGLIYVNPEGPNGNPDPLLSARDIRTTFARMAMNDEETVALIAGGHTFGKAHGAADPSKHVGPEPEGASIETQGLGWTNTYGTGSGEHTITSGLEGAWTNNPIKWDNNYFENLFGFEWELTESPTGAKQWRPKNGAGEGNVPDAHVSGKTHTPVMFTTDLALREDPEYCKVSEHFLKNPDVFADAFARAWYKLTHRDMGPVTRCFGPLVPAEPQVWQDPVPVVDHAVVDEADLVDLKAKKLAVVISALEAIQKEFNDANVASGKKVSLADLIVLAGGAAIEEAAKKAGHAVTVPFTPKRTDATQEHTDVESFAVLEPLGDGFRNFVQKQYESKAAEILIDKANLLDLSPSELAVLEAGLRVLGANHNETQYGVFTQQPGVLTNDFFTNLLDMNTKWSRSSGSNAILEGKDSKTGEITQLRGISECYAYNGVCEGLRRCVGQGTEPGSI